MHYRLPLVLEPQPEGGYTATSPVLPELVTEGDTLDELLANVRDAFSAVLEIYQDQRRTLPAGLELKDTAEPVRMDLVIAST
jgi:antitoxin HicB